MAISYSALKTECQTDPTGLGLTAQFNAGNDSIVADILNLPRVAIQIKRGDIQPSEVFHALDLADLVTNPGATTNSYLECLLTAPYTLRLLNDDGSNTPVQTNILTLLKAGSTPTKTRLSALTTRNGSRAEQLFGAGTFLTATDVALARAA